MSSTPWLPNNSKLRTPTNPPSTTARTKLFKIFVETDIVYLSTGLLRNKPWAKIRQRLVGKYAICCKNIFISLPPPPPPFMQCQNASHILKLKPSHTPVCPQDNVPGQIDAPHEDFIVDAILDLRLVNSLNRHRRGPILQFRAYWVGYGATHDSWDLAPNINTWKLFTTLPASA
jgi:hypothetical protein